MTAAPPPKVEPCRSCQAMIVWAKMPSGKWSPFDAKPERRFILRPGPDGVTQAEAQSTFQVHWATCPNADAHRRPT
jgi:hypothetical protein